jgi:hypothetical protein
MFMDEFYDGKRKTIWLYPGAQESWDDAESSIPPDKKGAKKKGSQAQFRARIAQFADTGELRSPDHMNSEGDGCFVIKANCGLRAWGWMQHVEGRAAFIISHVVLKRTKKADPADLERTKKARKIVKETLK